MGGPSVNHAARHKQGQLDRLSDTPWLRLHTTGHNQVSAPHTATTMRLTCPRVYFDPLPVPRNAHIRMKTYGELQGAAHMSGTNLAQALQLS